MNGQRIGYVRVSTFEQNAVRQLDGIELDCTFTEKASGKDTKRPQLDALRSFVRNGDTVVGIASTGLPAIWTIFAILFRY
jgi:DNA invertase Pin-like site-specific DNA recombinase